MPLYDFRCPEGHVTEQRTATSVDRLACPACGKLAARQFHLARPDQFRFWEGYHVTASDVLPEKGKEYLPKIWPAASLRPRSDPSDPSDPSDRQGPGGRP